MLKNSLKTTASVKEAFKNEDGAIDLASIMVGIIVIGIIGGVIAASVFSVIPWAQDNAAKAALGSVGTAESAYVGFASETGASTYGTYDDLKTKSLLSDSTTIKVSTNAAKDCYLAVSASSSGKFFYTTNAIQQPKLYVNGDTSTCANLPSIVADLGGPAAAAPLAATLATGSQSTWSGFGSNQGFASYSNPGSTQLAALRSVIRSDAGTYSADNTTGQWVSGGKNFIKFGDIKYFNGSTQIATFLNTSSSNYIEIAQGSGTQVTGFTNYSLGNAGTLTASERTAIDSATSAKTLKVLVNLNGQLFALN